MRSDLGRLFALAAKQHGVVATWQRGALGVSARRMEALLRGLRRVHQGVYAMSDLTELGWYMAAALALGPTAVISHSSAVMLLGLRPHQPREIHVSVPSRGGRKAREGIIVHRPSRPLAVGHCHGVPVTSPTQSLTDAALEPYALYRAIEEAATRGYHLDLPLDGIVALHGMVRGRTRSDAEAKFVLLCAGHGIDLPLVNHRVNGIEADFHWPDRRLVVEIDGWEFHRDREQFEEDRRRNLVHRAAGYEVLRISARQVERDPELVLAAVSAA